MAFFFGPGLALDLAAPSTPAPSSLFAPVFGLGSPFWELSSAGDGLMVDTVDTGVEVGLALGSGLISAFVSAGVAGSRGAMVLVAEGEAFVEAALRVIFS